ncbi:hypothetical protein LCGC14_1975350, partial [marine sediment metagenome]
MGTLLARWEIIESELLEWLKSYNGPRYHAVLSDPPYALISITKRFGRPSSVPAQHGSDGRFSRLSKGFMSSEWDSFRDYEHYQSWVSEWAKLLIEKALYPGAVCLFFGGTRTFHHLGVGLETGGFEIVDCLMWLHGQGFPKSHDVSKGIDKINGESGRAGKFVTWLRTTGVTKKQVNQITNTVDMGRHYLGTDQPAIPTRVLWKKLRPLCGDIPLWVDELVERIEAEREVIETRTDLGKRMINYLPTEETEFDVTAPATDPAKQWDGYGTALKPAWEPVFLCRAPRGKYTFAQLVVEFGSGALNIDGGRLGYASESDKAGATPQGRPTSRQGGLAGGLQDDRDRIDFERPEQKGRWPANLILSHTDECVKVGEFEVEGRVINRWKDGMLPFGGGAGQEYETVDPARAGEPSAERTYEHEGGTDFAMKPGARRGTETVDLYACVPSCPMRMLDDQAGELHSGFFSGHRNSDKTRNVYGAFKGTNEDQSRPANTGGPSRFFYTAKANRSEKDKGLENFYWKRTDDGFERIGISEYEGLDKRGRAHGCIHPTVKPLELLRYLST